MSINNSSTTIFAVALSAILSGGAVYAALTFLQPASAGPGFNAAVHDYLVENPEILIEMEQVLAVRQESEQQAVRQQALNAVGIDALLDPTVSFVEGPDDAKATVIEFFDYRCGYCKATLPAMKAVLADRPDVRFAFVEYPILTDDSLVAARAAVASRRQAGMYMPFHLALMETQGDLPLERILSIAESVGIDVAQLQVDMEDPSILESIEKSYALAQDLRVNGTPTFVINGKMVVGQISEAQLISYIDQEQS